MGKIMPTVFITGSGKRIGRGLALNFADKGWNIAIHYNNSKKEAKQTFEKVKTKGVKAVLVRGDVRNYEEIERAFDEAVDALGIPDVLVNNAGVFPAKKKIQDLDTEMWDWVQDVNLRAHYYTSKIYKKYEPKNARIVNFASLGGFEIWKNRLPYHASKAGALHLTRALAREFAPDISVNSISPGTIFIPNEPGPDPDLIPTDKIPMRRYGSIDDIFEAVWFFSTCTPFITGQNLIVDGGYHIQR